jgi:ligand-binding sensor domain-containing protein
MKTKYSFLFAGILISAFFPACEKDQDILDPATPMHTWSYFTTADGIPSDSINFIFEDSDGNIWVATNAHGVCKFNGNRWKIFNESDGLLNDKVMSINQDNSGKMWFSSPFGFSIFDGVSNFNNVEKTGNDEWIYANKMIKDKRGWIWATDFFTIGFYIYDGFDFYYFDFGGNYTSVSTIAEDPNGKIFLAYNGGVFNFYIDNKGEQNWIDYPYSDKLYADYTNYIYFDSRGLTWFGHQEADRVTKLAGPDAEYINLYNGWSYTNVTSILEDNKQNIWFTLKEGGVIKYNNVEPEVLGVNSGLSDDNITCSMIDRSGNIWFGTKGSGICVYKPAK